MSTNKTENYALHSWEPGDDFLLSEINENFFALDRLTQMTCGIYTGDGAGERDIHLDFAPAAVLLMDETGIMLFSGYSRGGLALLSAPVRKSKCDTVVITNSGFRVFFYTGDSDYHRTNTKDLVYHYIAFR